MKTAILADHIDQIHNDNEVFAATELAELTGMRGDQDVVESLGVTLAMARGFLEEAGNSDEAITALSAEVAHKIERIIDTFM